MPGTPPVGAVCVLDTDTFNETVDQFALAYLIGKAREGRVDLRLMME